MRLTDLAIRALPFPESGQRKYFDDTLAGFGCRVSQGGTKTFVVQHGPTRQLITIGRFPIISLAQARAEAKRILAERTLGKHQPEKISWDDAVALFLTRVGQKNRPRTHADYKRLLERHFKFGATKLAAIAPGDVHRRLDKLAHIPSERSHALRVIKILFNWARPRYVDRSPCDGMEVPKGTPRTRRLTDAELVTVWRAADQGTHFHRIVRLCILLGHPRTIRTLQRYCVSGHLDCLKMPTRLGDTYRVTPESVTRHVAQLKEFAATNVAAERGQPRPDATIGAPEIKDISERVQRSPARPTMLSMLSHHYVLPFFIRSRAAHRLASRRRLAPGGYHYTSRAQPGCKHGWSAGFADCSSARGDISEPTRGRGGKRASILIKKVGAQSFPIAQLQNSVLEFLKICRSQSRRKLLRVSGSNVKDHSLTVPRSRRPQ